MKNSFKILFFFSVIGLLSFKNSFNMESKANNTMDSTTFDFWLGKWNATWDENGTICHGTNTITHTMAGKFIHESFNIVDGTNKGFKGESFSILDKTDKKWKQTWIDTDGSYLDFTGAMDGDTKTFERTYSDKDGKIKYQRMRFYFIQKDSFIWDWEKSVDGIKWALSWRINYTRVK